MILFCREIFLHAQVKRKQSAARTAKAYHDAVLYEKRKKGGWMPNGSARGWFFHPEEVWEASILPLLALDVAFYGLSGNAPAEGPTKRLTILFSSHQRFHRHLFKNNTTPRHSELRISKQGFITNL
jgi:hypothetical protein